jgi:hypothetical protein
MPILKRALEMENEERQLSCRRKVCWWTRAMKSAMWNHREDLFREMQRNHRNDAWDAILTCCNIGASIRAIALDDAKRLRGREFFNLFRHAVLINVPVASLDLLLSAVSDKLVRAVLPQRLVRRVNNGHVRIIRTAAKRGLLGALRPSDFSIKTMGRVAVHRSADRMTRLGIEEWAREKDCLGNVLEAALDEGQRLRWLTRDDWDGDTLLQMIDWVYDTSGFISGSRRYYWERVMLSGAPLRLKL